MRSRHSIQPWLLLAVLSQLAVAQPFPMRYVRPLPLKDSGPQLQGRDKAGKPWSATFAAPGGGMGVTHLWSADFDHDGQLDYLVARRFGLGGSCPKRASVLLLLFDELGRPVPWKFETPDPVAVFDADHDGNAEFVAAPCDSLTGKRALGESWIESAFRPTWEGDPTTRIDVLTEPAPHSVADLGGIVLSGGREMPRPEDLILDSPRAAISTSISWTLRSFGCCGTVIR